MVLGTAVTNTVAMTPEVLARIPGYDEEYSGWSCIIRDPMALPSQALDTIPLTRKLTLSGTGREAHICAFVSPALITAALKGFTMPEGSSLLWQMGGRYYGINGNILTEEPLSDIPAEQLDVDMLDDSTEVYSIAAGYDAQLMVRYPIGVHDLYLIEIIPNGPLQRQIPYLSDSLVISLLAILVLGLLLAFLLHRMITPPITALQNRITKISSGDFSFDPAIEWNNELGDIGRGINSMSASVTALMDHRLEDEKQKQDLEYRMLQNQINPHFIYNTLDNIRYLIPTDPQRAQQLIGRFIGILRYSINNTKHNVTVKDDLKYLQDYLVIQSTRFGANFSYEIDIDDACMEFIIPKLLLQPLLENSIKYGFQKKPCIHIRVRGWLGEDALYFTVEDNGGGVDETMLEQLRDILRSDEVNIEHNGLQNINRRIWLGYGGDSGLTIDSTEGEGFTVKLKLRLGGM